jgi:hypothetical protein
VVNDYGAQMKRYRQEKTGMLGENPVAAAFFPPKIPHEVVGY